MSKQTDSINAHIQTLTKSIDDAQTIDEIVRDALYAYVKRESLSSAADLFVMLGIYISRRKQKSFTRGLASISTRVLSGLIIAAIIGGVMFAPLHGLLALGIAAIIAALGALILIASFVAKKAFHGVKVAEDIRSMMAENYESMQIKSQNADDSLQRMRQIVRGVAHYYSSRTDVQQLEQQINEFRLIKKASDKPFKAYHGLKMAVISKIQLEFASMRIKPRGFWTRQESELYGILDRFQRAENGHNTTDSGASVSNGSILNESERIESELETLDAALMQALFQIADHRQKTVSEAQQECERLERDKNEQAEVIRNYEAELLSKEESKKAWEGVTQSQITELQQLRQEISTHLASKVSLEAEKAGLLARIEENAREFASLAADRLNLIADYDAQIERLEAQIKSLRESRKKIRLLEYEEKIRVKDEALAQQAEELSKLKEELEQARLNREELEADKRRLDQRIVSFEGNLNEKRGNIKAYEKRIVEQNAIIESQNRELDNLRRRESELEVRIAQLDIVAGTTGETASKAKQESKKSGKPVMKWKFWAKEDGSKEQERPAELPGAGPESSGTPEQDGEDDTDKLVAGDAGNSAQTGDAGSSAAFDSAAPV